MIEPELPLTLAFYNFWCNARCFVHCILIRLHKRDNVDLRVSLQCGSKPRTTQKRRRSFMCLYIWHVILNALTFPSVLDYRQQSLTWSLNTFKKVTLTPAGISFFTSALNITPPLENVIIYWEGACGLTDSGVQIRLSKPSLVWFANSEYLWLPLRKNTFLKVKKRTRKRIFHISHIEGNY